MASKNFQRMSSQLEQMGKFKGLCIKTVSKQRIDNG